MKLSVLAKSPFSISLLLSLCLAVCVSVSVSEYASVDGPQKLRGLAEETTYPRSRQAYCQETATILCFKCRQLSLEEKSESEVKATCIRCADGYKPRDEPFHWKETLVHDYRSSCEKEELISGMYIILIVVIVIFVVLILSGVFYKYCSKKDELKRQEQMKKARQYSDNSKKSKDPRSVSAVSIQENPQNMPLNTEKPLLTQNAQNPAPEPTPELAPDQIQAQTQVPNPNPNPEL